MKDLSMSRDLVGVRVVMGWKGFFAFEIPWDITLLFVTCVHSH